MMIRANDPAWFEHLRAGDVLRSRGGTLRVVRTVTRKKDGRLWGVSFVIMRCSWTKRPYTIYTFTDLKVFRFTYVGARVRLDSELDRKILRAIRNNGERSLSCCAVRGVA
jgi:hypothetical protein